MGQTKEINAYNFIAGIDVLFNLSPDLLCLFSIDGKILKANCAFKNALGYKDEDIVLQDFIDFVHPDDVEATFLKYKALTRNESALLFRNRYRCADGEYKSLSWNANQLPDGTLYASARDVSDIIIANKIKQNALKKLKLSNERYKLVTAATHDVIWDWDLKRNTLKWSKSFEDNFGYPTGQKKEPITTWSKHIHEDDKESVINSIREAITTPSDKFWREEYRYYRADGSIALIIDQGYIIRNHDGKAIRMVGAMQDITELKEKELRICNQNERLTDIAQINSHELRRPVASILGLLQLFDSEKITDESSRELLEHLKVAAFELDEVIRRIVDKTVA
ncbi:PAS domain-containing protein [Mucilaginibacter agri]|uniref:histidine kinase n=1 Tax=Mucilaginibacter agri TaxID=2695265 RepID=A0A965ZLS1_9SPHI|nr:PAS domain-containing protein [Mucilaginibacter agri]NCD71946.1 PAS domain-containing protein [Mucilaginibacter agri]